MRRVWPIGVVVGFAVLTVVLTLWGVEIKATTVD